MRRSFVAALMIATLVPLARAAATGEAAKKKAAVAAAEAWVKLVDHGRYGASWKEAATYFKGAVTREQWEQMLNGARAPLGKVGSRRVTSATFTTHAPGAPDGQYVVVQFDTSFAHKKSAVETVTPMLDKDGKWRVSGYFIR